MSTGLTSSQMTIRSTSVFSSAIPLYQQALIDSGYDFKLKYNPEAGSDSQSKRNRRRTRQIVWFNPPYSMNIETNIGQEFLKLIDNFPQNNILAPVMKRNKVQEGGVHCLPSQDPEGGHGCHGVLHGAHRRTFQGEVVQPHELHQEI